MNKRVLLLLVILLPLVFAGCWDGNEPERMHYVHGIGVDYQDGEYEIFIQLVNFSTIAKSEQPPSPDTLQAEFGRGKGKTIYDAIFKVYHTVDERLFWGHFSYIIFTEEALASGQALVTLNSLIRYRETRYRTWVYGTTEKLEDLLLTTPVLDKAISLSKLTSPLNSYEQESNITPLDLRRLIIRLNEPSHEVLIPQVKIRENWENEKGKNKATDLAGVAMLSRNKFSGFLTSHQVRGLQWMSHDTERAELTTEIGDALATVVIDKINVKKEVKDTAGELRFTVDISLQATVNGFDESITEQEIRRAVEKKVRADVEATFEEGVQAQVDLYRFSEYLYRHKLGLWKKYENDGAIPLQNSSLQEIHVHVDKINSGRKSFKDTF